jgi:hypothetical protein
MTDPAAAGATETSPGAEVAVRGGISGSVVKVRLGVVLGVVALIAAFALLAIVISGQHLWWGVPLAVVALGVSGYAAFLGIYGVIRYGLFTEGYSGSEVAGELRLSKIAWTAGIVSEIALLLTVALCVALVVRALA